MSDPYVSDPHISDSHISDSYVSRSDVSRPLRDGRQIQAFRSPKQNMLKKVVMPGAHS